MAGWLSVTVVELGMAATVVSAGIPVPVTGMLTRSEDVLARVTVTLSATVVELRLVVAAGSRVRKPEPTLARAEGPAPLLNVPEKTESALRAPTCQVTVLPPLVLPVILPEPERAPNAKVWELLTME